MVGEGECTPSTGVDRGHEKEDGRKKHRLLSTTDPNWEVQRPDDSSSKSWVHNGLGGLLRGFLWLQVRGRDLLCSLVLQTPGS